MSSYTADQYADQRRITKQIGEANRTGLCVVCNRRRLAYWPTGQRRITCGADECYRKWLRVRPEAPAEAGKEDNNG